jgi:glycosyltransferase involved in cell wall biosynthesis
MRIAFVGTRGVPARYSGFETFVEQLGIRLVDREHNVTVYSRLQTLAPREATYRGMRQVWVRGISTKHLDTITHTLVSCTHMLFHEYDIVVMCIAGNSPLAWMPRLRGARVVLNVDGSDWRRKKWGRLARAYMRSSEWLATRTPSVTVTDSHVMHRYYLDRFGEETECIPYGADMPTTNSTTTLRRYGLESRRYLLLVGRLVPENCIDHLVDAFEKLDTDLQCVVVGDAPYQERYIADLKRRGPHVVFTGYVFGEGYRELMQHAYAFILCSEVGGTHPVLVEAMAAGNCVVVNDTPANLEVIGDSGVPYAGDEGARGLAMVLQALLCDADRVAKCRKRAKARAHSLYSWERVTDQYEQLFTRLMNATAVPPDHRFETGPSQ